MAARGEWRLTVWPDESPPDPRSRGHEGEVLVWSDEYDIGDDNPYATPRVFLVEYAKRLATEDELDELWELGYADDDEGVDALIARILGERAIVIPLGLRDDSLGLRLYPQGERITRPEDLAWRHSQVGYTCLAVDAIGPGSEEQLAEVEEELLTELDALNQFLSGEAVGYTLECVSNCPTCGQEQRIAVAKQHDKVANRRADFLHKLSRRMVDENQVICAESLHVKGMLANHHLAKSISDCGWSEYLRQLKYKGEWYGCDLLQCERFFPSSKRCHHCGYILDSLPLSVRKWTCPVCGAILDRDENAAINIKAFCTVGTTGTHTPGESPVGDSSNPEAPAFRRG